MYFVSAKPYTPPHRMTLNSVNVSIALFSRLDGKFIFSRTVCFYQSIVLIQMRIGVSCMSVLVSDELNQLCLWDVRKFAPFINRLVSSCFPVCFVIQNMFELFIYIYMYKFKKTTKGFNVLNTYLIERVILNCHKWNKTS